MEEKANALPTSEHFELEQLAAGVYAAIGIPGGAAYSNAGFVDLGDQTLIFDTFQTPQAAQDLKAAAEQLTGRPASCVIISHCHADHWCGNQVFDPGVPIITTHATYQEMPASIAWVKALQQNPSELEQNVQKVRKDLEAEIDECWRASYQANLTRLGHLSTAIPTLELRFPNQTFEGKVIFYGTSRTVELCSVAPAHTTSDAYLLLPEERIMFMGDLGFFQCQPFMAFCDPEAWKAQLEAMEQSDVEVFVPGHGPLGTRADAGLQKRYIAVLQDLIAGAVRDGLSLEETLALPLPAPFDAWLHGGMGRWEANVQALYQRRSV
jgi:glyoxylase-like metal-dependent hydrolase (beta-lactamase superfamily II)